MGPASAQSDDVAKAVQRVLAPLADDGIGEFAWQIEAAGDQQVPITLEFARESDQAFWLRAESRFASFLLLRDADSIRLIVPEHRVVFVGHDPRLAASSDEHLAPEGLVRRMFGERDGALSLGLAALQLQIGLATLRAERGDRHAVQLGDVTLALDSDASDPDTRGSAPGGSNGDRATSTATRLIARSRASGGFVEKLDTITLSHRLGSKPPPADVDIEGYAVHTIERTVLERSLFRAIRRAVEILALPPIDEPTARTVEGGELRIDEHRTALLYGDAATLGRAHGELLAPLVRRTVDSTLHLVGSIETVRTGRWFQDHLRDAWTRLEPHIPARHIAEIDALADAVPGVSREELRFANVFPEYFHCSGFAVFGAATVDGELYHGRVLDYMTHIGLQHAAVTFVVRPDHGHGFVNVGYAGFVGSVTGMNSRGLSLGELGGAGRGDWDGVPMATLMRRGLEECSTSAELRALFRDSPRTCEYFYVFGDGKTRKAVGVAATPAEIQFVEPGATHERLLAGVPDTVIFSAGRRLELLHERIRTQHGAIDLPSAIRLMDRPVAMASNLHNALFVPARREVWIAHAGTDTPAAEQKYVPLQLDPLLDELDSRCADRPRALFVTDTLTRDDDPNADAAAMLRGLRWPASDATIAAIVTERAAITDPAAGFDALVMFDSPLPTGDPQNDRVVLEWYRARGRDTEYDAPAVLLLHILDGRMRIARTLATGLARLGIHALVMHMPRYGLRGDRADREDPSTWFRTMQQAIADARRSRDVLAALPGIDPARIGLQGTSLGAFVAASASALDDGFDRTFLVLGGGGLREMFANGEQDVAKLRARIEAAGLDLAGLGPLLDAVDPARIAHRLRNESTWLYSARLDRVVPAANARALGTAAKLDEQHHLWFDGDHYSSIVHLPRVLHDMVRIMRDH